MVELVSDYSEKKDNVFTDMVLTVEGEKFHVCKSTLATFSNYCQNIFFGNWSDSKKSIHELPGVTAHQFQLALDFLYHKIDVTEQNAEDLLEVARYLQIQTIVARCEKELCEERKDGKGKLKISRFRKLYLADKYALSGLLDHLLQNANKPEVMGTFLSRARVELSEATLAKFMQRIDDLKKKKADEEEKEKADKAQRKAQRRNRRVEMRRQQAQPPRRDGMQDYRRQGDDYAGQAWGGYERQFYVRVLGPGHGRYRDADHPAEHGNGAGGLEARAPPGFLEGPEPPRFQQLEQDAPAQRPPRAQDRQAMP